MDGQSYAAGGNDAPVPSRLIITYAGPGSAECTIAAEGTVTIAQVGAAAWLLAEWARELRASDQERRRAGGLVIPAPAAPAQLADLRRNGR